MKGIILAAGLGTRLRPLTYAVTKCCLPVQGKPMIYHSIEKFVNVGIRDILIIASTDSIEALAKCVGSGDSLDCKIHFTIQEKPLGLSHAVLMGKEFVGNSSFIMLLGDNFFEDSLRTVKDTLSFSSCVLATKQVPNPQDYGVLELNKDGTPKEIFEKPANPTSNQAVVGIYGYDPTVFSVIETLKPSARGELEITDLNNNLLKAGVANFVELKGYWVDIGSVESYEKANRLTPTKGDWPVIEDVIDYNWEF